MLQHCGVDCTTTTNTNTSSTALLVSDDDERDDLAIPATVGDADSVTSRSSSHLSASYPDITISSSESSDSDSDGPDASSSLDEVDPRNGSTKVILTSRKVKTSAAAAAIAIMTTTTVLAPVGCHSALDSTTTPLGCCNESSDGRISMTNPKRT